MDYSHNGTLLDNNAGFTLDLIADWVVDCMCPCSLVSQVNSNCALARWSFATYDRNNG
jgi:hypothetical protein